MVKRGGRWELDHEAPWERYVQSRIRADAKPPAAAPLHLWAGRDPKGFGAVLMYEQLDGPHQVDVHYVAVALRHRGRGGGAADEMMRTLMDNLTQDAMAQGAHAVQALAWIHERNAPSQRLFRRFGFQQVEEGPEGLQRWGALVLISGADIYEH